MIMPFVHTSLNNFTFLFFGAPYRMISELVNIKAPTDLKYHTCGEIPITSGY